MSEVDSPEDLVVRPTIVATPELLALIGAVVEAARPGIQADGGDIEFVELQGDIVRVRLSGACVHCALASQTLGNLRRQLVERSGLLLRVLPAAAD